MSKNIIMPTVLSWLFQRSVLFLLLALIGVTGCGDDDSNVPASLPTRGELTIGIDESLRPFADAEIATFSAYYPDARVTPLYLPEKQVVEKLLANEIQTAIICRDLYPDESAHIAGSCGHSTRAFKLGDDDIIVVANQANPVSELSFETIRGILSGTITGQERLPVAINDKSPTLVILTRSSSIDRYFSSSVPLSPDSTYALETTADVIEYVQKNARAIGIVGGSWFYQKGSTLNGIKILTGSTSTSENRKGSKRLSREVYAVTHEPNTGLGSGFISFMAGQKGQLILSKAGMTPYKPISREIKLLDSIDNL